MCNRHPIHCIIPPYIMEHLAQSEDPQIRAAANASLAAAEEIRASRAVLPATPSLGVRTALPRRRYREVYDAHQTRQLPGELVRSEGEAPVDDVAVNEVYDFSGDAYDFYDEVFQRNSLDNEGMVLISSVHVLPKQSALWNGRQMAYGDGDGRIFRRFTRALDVVGHELTHGVQAFTSNLQYHGQSGALNEHFSDVFGVLIHQWRNCRTAADASWLIGAEILFPVEEPAIRRGIRDMENPGTAYNDPALGGKDPQPDHMRLLCRADEDRGGVHRNSGIPNKAFVLTAKALGGYAWDIAGRIWYKTMLTLPRESQFVDCARRTVQVAVTDYGSETAEVVRAGWDAVGITV